MNHGHQGILCKCFELRRLRAHLFMIMFMLFAVYELMSTVCILFFSNKWDPGRLWSLWLLFLISYYYLRGHLSMIMMIIVMINYYNIILLSPCSPAVLFCQDYDHHAWMLFECIFNYVWLSTFLIITVFNELFIRLSPLYLRSPRTDRAQHFFFILFLFFSYFFHLALIEPSTFFYFYFFF